MRTAVARGIALRPGGLDRAMFLFRCVLMASAGVYVLLYIALVALRIRYPFELQAIEGSALDQVRRILAGRKLYVEPSLEFVPLYYNPLFFYVSAGMATVVGDGFLPLRLVSLLSSLGCFTLIFLFVKRETGNIFPAILGSCLFAATFRLSGPWFDVGRIDTLFLALLLAGFYAIKFTGSRPGAILAGILIALAYFTKQTVLVIALPILLYTIFADRRRAPFLIGTIGLLIGGGILALDFVHDGWYLYYTSHLLQRFTLEAGLFIRFWTTDIAVELAIPLCLALLYLLIKFGRPDKKNAYFYSAAATGMLLGAALSRAAPGGWINNLMPAHAIVSILFGLAAHTVRDLVQDVRGTTLLDCRRLKTFFYLVCIVQFVGLLYDPTKLVPTRADWDTGRGLVNTIATIEGDVFVPYYSYLPAQVGKKTYAGEAAIGDVVFNDQREVGTRLTNDLRRAIRERRFGAIIVEAVDGQERDVESDLFNASFATWFQRNFALEIAEHYVARGPALEEEAPFWRSRNRVRVVYVPKRE